MLLYTIKRDTQASYDDALKAVVRDRAYPLGAGKHSTRLAKRALPLHPLLEAVASIFTPLLVALGLKHPHYGSIRSTPRSRHRSSTNRIVPTHQHGRFSPLPSTDIWRPKKMVRTSLAERDLLVKRAVYSYNFADVHCGLLGQMTDGHGSPVLVMEVCFPPCCSPFP